MPFIKLKFKRVGGREGGSAPDDEKVAIGDYRDAMTIVITQKTKHGPIIKD